jgi:hypothetical protein
MTGLRPEHSGSPERVGRYWVWRGEQNAFLFREETAAWRERLPAGAPDLGARLHEVQGGTRGQAGAPAG